MWGSFLLMSFSFLSLKSLEDDAAIVSIAIQLQFSYNNKTATVATHILEQNTALQMAWNT
jgi:hypothetical protein